jgi:hypothetical protein
MGTQDSPLRESSAPSRALTPKAQPPRKRSGHRTAGTSSGKPGVLSLWKADAREGGSPTE